MFDAAQAQEAEDLVKIDENDLLIKSINYSQKLAIEKVLSAPDLALIQGPLERGKLLLLRRFAIRLLAVVDVL